MANTTPTKSKESPIKGSGPESPTTVRPLDMDDDDVQESGNLGTDAPASNRATVEDEAPPKPPRPLSQQEQAENTLKEAFPNIDAAVVKAVLRASGGRVEPAFNALLGMSDPDAVREPTPPPQPPRPVVPRVGSTPQSQLEADEQYARQLAEHYGSGSGYSGERRSTSGGNYPGGQPRRVQTGYARPSDIRQEDERNFLDDDLPIIKENLKKGFFETQKTVNGWLTNLKKKIDGEDGEEESQHAHQRYGAQYRGRRSADGRRSGDYNNYDADPQVLSDDFAGMQMNSDAPAGPPRRSTRPLANPDLFKPTPAWPNDSRKVSFQGGQPEEVGIYGSSPKLGARETAPPTSKQSKWQPLSTVDPSPIGESDNDPFSLGDSEDEKESKDRVGGKEIKMEDTDRLKKAAAEAMNDSISEPARKPEAAEITGTKDKIADDKLSGKA